MGASLYGVDVEIPPCFAWSSNIVPETGIWTVYGG